MPFQLTVERGSRRLYRCEVCGRLTHNPIVYKTCCMNKPVYFCSPQCMRAWIARWMRNQEQTGRASKLRRISL